MLVMIFTKNRKKRDEYYQQIDRIYNSDSIIISSKLREELLNSAKGLQKGDQISYLAFKFNELIAFKKYLEKTRWKYYWGSVLIR